MGHVPLSWYLILSAVLFGTGAAGLTFGGALAGLVTGALVRGGGDACASSAEETSTLVTSNAP